MIGREFGIYDALFGWVGAEVHHQLEDDRRKPRRQTLLLTQGPHYRRTIDEILTETPNVRISDINNGSLIFISKPGNST